VNPLYETMATSVFERMSGLAAKHGAVNLGQGLRGRTNMLRRAGFLCCGRRSRRIMEGIKESR
jgi:hypothetical protein